MSSDDLYFVHRKKDLGVVVQRPLRARLIARGGLVRRVEREADDRLGSLDGADLVLHRRCRGAAREVRLGYPVRMRGE